MSTSRDISNALTLLNLAIAAVENSDTYRRVVAQAVAEGRDISDAELAQAAAELDAAIESAAKS